MTRFVLAFSVFALACGDDDAGTDSGGRDSSVDSATDAPRADTNGEDTGRTDTGGIDAARRDAMPPEECALPTPIDDGVTYENTLYVEAGSSGDGSEGNPFGDIEDAAAAATPGTRVIVRAGTYDHVRAISPQGEAGRPITFEAEGAVIIDAPGEVGWSMTDPRYVVVEGFTIQNAGIHGMNISDGGSYETPGEFLVLRNITIPSAGSGGNNDCIKMSGIDDFWVLDSNVSGCNSGEIIDMVGCHRGVISGNQFSSPVANGVQTKGGSSDTIITGNVFIDIPGHAVNAGGSTGLEFIRPIDANHEAARIRVVSNLFIRGGSAGTQVAFIGCDACEFTNNTIIEPIRWIARILQGNTDPRFVLSRNGLFANNIIVVNTADIRAWFNVGPATEPESFTFANNLWFALDDPGFGGPNYGGTGIPAGTGELIQMDPMMVDRAGNDFRLMAGSPAQGAGRDVGVLPPDMDGRCYEDPPTLGAYEIP